MLKKFEEFVNERLFGSGISRANTKQDRLEDTEDTNIDELKEIDLGLPFVFANIDLYWNGDRSYGYDEWMSLKGYIERHGWRIPTKEDMEMVKSNERIKISSRHIDTNYYFVLHNMDSYGETVAFQTTKTNGLYFGLLDRTDDNYRFTIANAGKEKIMIISAFDVKDDLWFFLRLVKDKE